MFQPTSFLFRSAVLATSLPLFLALALCMGMAAGPAHAAPIVFFDRASWNAALPGGAPDFNEAFEGVAPLPAQFRTAPLDVGPFSLVQTGGFTSHSTNVITSAFQGAGTDPLGGLTNFALVQVLGGGTGFDVDLFQLDAPLFAWAGDYSDLTSTQLTITLTGGGTETIAVPDDAGFIGFTNAVSFTKLAFQTAQPLGQVSHWDNVSGSSTLPEPSSLALVIGALLGLVAWRRPGTA